MANVYVFEVPYTERCYGFSEYRIDAPSEDVAKDTEDLVQKTTDDYIKSIDDVLEKKETEIMTI